MASLIMTPVVSSTSSSFESAQSYPDQHSCDCAFEPKAGYTVVVATNQSGVARKLFPMTATAYAIHQKMHATVEQAGWLTRLRAVYLARSARMIIATAANLS